MLVILFAVLLPFGLMGLLLGADRLERGLDAPTAAPSSDAAR